MQNTLADTLADTKAETHTHTDTRTDTRTDTHTDVDTVIDRKPHTLSLTQTLSQLKSLDEVSAIADRLLAIEKRWELERTAILEAWGQSAQVAEREAEQTRLEHTALERVHQAEVTAYTEQLARLCIEKQMTERKLDSANLALEQRLSDASALLVQVRALHDAFVQSVLQTDDSVTTATTAATTATVIDNTASDNAASDAKHEDNLKNSSQGNSATQLEYIAQLQEKFDCMEDVLTVSVVRSDSDIASPLDPLDDDTVESQIPKETD
jgi:hypothetical protein